MAPWHERLTGRMTIVRSLLRFFWTQRLWWAIPMVTVLLLLGLVLLIGQQAALAPFIYTLF